MSLSLSAYFTGAGSFLIFIPSPLSLVSARDAFLHRDVDTVRFLLPFLLRLLAESSHGGILIPEDGDGWGCLSFLILSSDTADIGPLL